MYIYLFILQGQGVGLLGMCLMDNLALLPAEPLVVNQIWAKGMVDFVYKIFLSHL
jgi:hypothetical protein